MNDIVIDTNCYNFFIQGDKKLVKVFSDASRIYLTAITLGELYSGFYNGNRLEENKRNLSNFLKSPRVSVLNVTEKTSEIYGSLLAILAKSGSPIPTNDVWIAACAIETDSVLVTYDKHFLSIPKLKLWDKIR